MDTVDDGKDSFNLELFSANRKHFNEYINLTPSTLNHYHNNMEEIFTCEKQISEGDSLKNTMSIIVANYDTIPVLNPPLCGQDINDKDNNGLVITNFTSVVKRESNEAINSSEDHIIFSGDASTARMEQEDTKDITNLESINNLPSTVKQEKFLTCEEQVLKIRTSIHSFCTKKL